MSVCTSWIAGSGIDILAFAFVTALIVATFIIRIAELVAIVRFEKAVRPNTYCTSAIDAGFAFVACRIARGFGFGLTYFVNANFFVGACRAWIIRWTFGFAFVVDAFFVLRIAFGTWITRIGIVFADAVIAGLIRKTCTAGIGGIAR